MPSSARSIYTCALLHIQVLAPAATLKLCPKCQLAALLDDQYICKPCNSKRATLSKAFKGWPIQAFQELSPELQADYWRQSGPTKQKLLDALTIAITRVRTQREIRKKSGKYLPESVLQAQGYNTAKIKANCPCQWDTQLEEHTYILQVDEVIEEKIRDDVVKLLDNMKDQSIRGRLSHYCSPPAKKKRKRSSSSGSSSKSSSSSRSKKLTESQKKAVAKAATKTKAASDACTAKLAGIEAKKKAVQEKAAEQKLKKADRLAGMQDRLSACAYPLLKQAVTTASAIVKRSGHNRFDIHGYAHRPVLMTTLEPRNSERQGQPREKLRKKNQMRSGMLPSMPLQCRRRRLPTKRSPRLRSTC
jgi:hypothetical protein